MPMSALTLLLLIVTPVGAGLAQVQAPAGPPGQAVTATCSGSRSRLLGLAARPLSLPEMVAELERGCLALVEVRFRPGEDEIESISPTRFAQVARALSLAQGAYLITVPPERAPGFWPDTLQARRRSIRLRDELVHYGASASRLRDDPGWPATAPEVAPGTAVPILVRVPDTRLSPDLP
ncbi:MAG: hypothetical protein AAB075_03920 [Gemmatimonadota bacterium]